MPKDDEIEKEIRELFGQREGIAPNGQNQKVKGNAVSICSVSGNDNQVVVGDHVIINNHRRRPGERIDDDQVEQLRDQVDALARIDADIAAARDPDGDQPYCRRLESARSRHWSAFRDRFHLKRYTHLTHGRFEEALDWLEDRRRELLDTIGPANEKRPLRRALTLRAARRLLFFGFVALVVPLIFSVERTRPPAIAVTVPITAAAPDPEPVFQPAAQSGPAPGFHIHAGCSFFQPLQPKHRARSI